MSTIKSVASGNKDKNVRLCVRISQNEMERLNSKARERGLDCSKYVRTLLSGSDENKQGLSMVCRHAKLCQDIFNIVEEKYSCEDNSLLEEKVEELWNLLSLSM